jgi:hypothetical protein
MLPERLANQRTDGEVGDVMVVHHVEVDDLSAGFDYGINFIAQPREIG